MKILVYGAGVIGSLYAAKLQESGQDVSILARGQRLADLREHGIVLEDGRTGKRTTTRVNVVERLEPDDAYDLVAVMMPKDYIPDVLPVLAANRQTPNILFMCNNAAGPDEMVTALGRERVLLGFVGAAGTREGHIVRYVIESERGQPTSFGELDGRTTPRLEQIASAFKGAGFHVAIWANMDAWLKTHVAEISPTANALYMAGGDNYRMACTRDSVVLMIRAMKEGYKVLGALGIPITPSSHKIVNWIPEPLLVPLVRKMLDNKEVELKVKGHAAAARHEMKQIADEFRALVRKTSVPTPAMDRLYTYIDPATPPVPEGSAEIPLNWRSVSIGLGVLAAMVLALTLLI